MVGAHYVLRVQYIILHTSMHFSKGGCLLHGGCAYTYILYGAFLLFVGVASGYLWWLNMILLSSTIGQC